MKFFISRNSDPIIILYSTLLILIFQLLLIKISPQIYSVFNPLPFLFVGLIVKFRDFLLSCILSLTILIVTNIFFEGIFQKQLIIFHLVISSITLLFFGAFNLAKRIHLNSSQLISIINIIFLSTFAVFYILFFNDLEHEQLQSFIKRSIDEIISNYGIPKSQELDKLINIIMLILPSVNFLIFFISFSFNFVLAKYIIQRIGIFQSTSIELGGFSSPLWYSFIYLLLLTFSLFQTSNSSSFVLTVNTLICMSFCYLLEGYESFNNYFKKSNFNIYVKFIIIFLLFIFLGYVLLLIILILGFFENIRKNLNKSK